MPKKNEIDYIKSIISSSDIQLDQLIKLFMNHPFSKGNPSRYLIDIGQILMLLPPPPCRLLDLGVGSGWTSEFFSKAGYEVVGLDICPDMIEFATKRLNGKLALEFYCCDYEAEINFGIFDCAVIYDALHHAENEERVIKNVFSCLKREGIFITVEPGKGHSISQDSIEAMQKFGTTEKDMEFVHQASLMHKAGFGYVEQIIRLSELNLALLRSSRTYCIISQFLADPVSL